MGEPIEAPGEPTDDRGPPVEEAGDPTEDPPVAGAAGLLPVVGLLPNDGPAALPAATFALVP